MATMPSAEQLLQDAAWLKRLAIRLANDRDDADDLVQESWIAAWRRQPDADRPMRAWLAKVVRDLAGMKRRSDRRRLVREALLEEAHPPATPDELVEQMRLHRLVVDLVLELDEPYRSTIIARFVEGRTSASIAKSLGIPAGTVRKRLHDGLARLRAGLDAKPDRKRWAPAVLAFAHGGMHVAKPTKLVLAVLAAILLTTAATVVILALPRSADTAHSDALPTAMTSKRRTHVVPESPAVHVVVAVTDAAGPIANAAVRCAAADGEIVIASARDGTASVDLAVGEWSIAASADGHEPSATTLDVVRDTRVGLVLVVGGRTLTGTVSDAGGGAIAGARIDAARVDATAKPGRAVAVGFTDRNGRYALTVGAGQLLVAASHPEYAAQTRFVDGATASFALVPGAVIEGVVRDAHTTQPVGGATVRARHDSPALELAEASEQVVVADAEGKFRVAGLRPGAYALSAREGMLGTRTPVRVALGIAEQQPDVVVLVAAGASIRGTVVDETGAPVRDVSVRASNGFREDGDATSNEAGGFVVEGLGPGRWMLRAANDGYVPQGQTIVALTTDDIDGVLVRVRRGLAIDGHIEPRQVCDVIFATDDDGNPSTAARDRFVTTADDGNFHFGPLAPGNATLTARCPNGDEGVLGVVAGATERVVAVKPGGAIAGRVVDTTDAPLAGVIVSAEPANDSSVTTVVDGAITSGFRAITSADGAFEIRGLDPADYRIAVLDRGRPMKAKKGTKVALTAAQRATGIEIVVDRPTGTIRGTVTGPDGVPLAEAWIALFQTPDDLLASINASDPDARPKLVRFDGQGGSNLQVASSDAHGRFELTNIPFGTYQVIAEAHAGRLRGRHANVTPDAEIAIDLAAVGSLRGTVHGARGPSELFTITLTGPTPDTRPFADGTFEFPRLDPGDYTIQVTSSDGTGTATARVASGIASVDISLVANATVTGRLVDRNHKPVPGVSVTLVTEQAFREQHIQLPELPPSSGPDGRFRVEGQPGKMALVVLGRPPAFAPGLTLDAGRALDVGDVTVNESP